MTMTYGELKQSIQDYTENDETTFVNNLPLFIRLAEERILKNVSLNLFQKNQFGNMTTGNQYLAAPSDFLAPFSLSFDINGDADFLYRPASLTAGADSGTTWLSENAELSLLYGSLVEAYIFMKGEPQMMQIYEQRMQESVARLKNLGEGQETNDEYRKGPVTRQRT